jgi:ABC-2 type transport system ATP-binding protein
MTVKVEQVSKLYGTQKALDQVSFELNKGEIVGFLGPNGAGKSTMMKIITAYIPADKGKVTVLGKDVNEHSLFIKEKIGYLAEQNPLYYEMYIREYLQFVAGVYRLKDKKSRVQQVIEQVGLEAESHKKIGQLSKGYKQRVGIAQAIIHDPEILILDEPTTGLDPNQLAEIRQLIKQLGKNKTVMLSTHIMQEVEAICDRIIIIHQGKIVANEKAADLSSKMGKNQILEVEFDQVIDERSLQQLEGIRRLRQLSVNHYQIETSDEAEAKKQILNWAVKKEVSINNFSRKKGRLEDIFKSLTADQKIEEKA